MPLKAILIPAALASLLPVVSSLGESGTTSRFMGVVEGSTSATMPIPIETEAQYLSVRAYLRSGSPGTFSVVLPGGGVLSDAQIIATGGTFLDISSPATPWTPDWGMRPWIPANGRVVSISLPGPLAAGTYGLRCSYAQPVVAKEAFMVSWESDQQLQTKLFIDSPLPFVNTPTIISAAVVQGIAPIPGAAVGLVVAREGDPEETTLTALDNGQPPDGVAGDGLYAVSFTPDSPGRYSVLATISGQTLGGAAFTRRHADAFQAMTPGGKFSTSRPFAAGVTRDPPNPAGKAKSINLNVPIDVSIAGDYLVIGKLRSPTGTAYEVRERFALEAGERTVTVSVPVKQLPAQPENGYYRWGELALLGPTSYVDWALDKREALPEAQSRVLLNETDWPVAPWRVSTVEWLPQDPDDDGRFDRLVVRIGVFLAHGGRYNLSAVLTGCCEPDCRSRTRIDIDRDEDERDAVGGTVTHFELEFSACSTRHIHGRWDGQGGIGPSGLLPRLGLRDVYVRWADPVNPKPYQMQFPSYFPLYLEQTGLSPSQFECYSITDANANGIPDACDIFTGKSRDTNANGVPDEADPPP